MPILELCRLVWAPGRGVVGIALECSKLSSASRLERGLKKIGAEVLGMIASKQSAEAPYSILLVVDATGHMAEVTGLASKAGAQVLEAIAPGVFVDVVHFPLRTDPFRAVLMPKPVYKALMKNLREEIGTGALAFLYHAGYEIGKEVVGAHSELFELEVDEVVELNKSLFASLGWGRVVDLSFDSSSGRATVVIEECFECELFRGLGRPASHFVRGILAGAMSAISGREAFSIEEECIAAGDEHCLFLVETRGRDRPSSPEREGRRSSF